MQVKGGLALGFEVLLRRVLFVGRVVVDGLRIWRPVEGGMVRVRAGKEKRVRDRNVRG